MIVTFLRHGSTEWNEQGRMQGRRDVPLSAAGRKEVEAWRSGMGEGSLVPKSAQWYSSPLRRAVETAEILSGASPQREPALIEMDWGDWEGLRLDELRERHGAAFVRNEAAGLDFRPAGGESPRDVRDRVLQWLRATAHRHESVVAVTHKGVMRAGARCRHRLGHDGKGAAAAPGRRAPSFEIDAEGRIGVHECNIRLAALPLAGSR
jgi:probable phosphoglycerate mutase